MIFVLFILLGLIVYFVFEKKEHRKYLAVFNEYQKKLDENTKLTNSEKIEKFSQMLLQNRYKIVEKKHLKVVGERKLLSIGLILIGVGFIGIGLLVYLFYYFYYQKPHKITYLIN